MSSARLGFDHFLTYTNAASIDDHLATYEALGFAPERRTVRHDPGLRNGFVFIGPEYLEFLWVEDEALFAEGGAEERPLRSECRPFGIGIGAADLQATHDDWIARGFTVPEIFSKGPRDAAPDAAPQWTFQEVPDGLLPGAITFVVMYCGRGSGTAHRVRVAPNTIYAIAGVTFVAAEPEARATCWRNLLAPEESVTRTETGVELAVGAHRARWIAPEAFEAAYDRQWVPASHACGELALVHLLAQDLGTVRAAAQHAGRGARTICAAGLQELLIEPDARDGFTFAVSQLPIDTWMHARTARTGETFEVVPAAS